MEQRKEQLRSIDGIPSIILDVMRLSVVLIVLYIHAREIWFPDVLNAANIHGDTGHAAVMVLVVLSGYVISFTVHNKHTNGFDYAVSRMSRVYSVLIPCLLLSIFSQVVISVINPAVYGDFSVLNSVLRYILSASLLNQALWISADPLVNGPLWTLSYEGMFYVLFGLLYYKCKTKKSKIILAIASVVLIPKILLLFPVWLSGVYAYKVKPLRLNPLISYATFSILIILGFLFVYYSPALPQSLGQKPLYYSGQFITDICFAMFIAGAFIFLPNGSSITDYVPYKVQKLIRLAGDLTYPVYVFHFPLLLLFRYVLIDYTAYNQAQFFGVLLIVLTISLFTGYYANKSRPFLYSVLCKLFDKISITRKDNSKI